ncbi:hypothetical protein A2875_03085 [Candidatus Gottesmanbacteria bacterium RIFCSPHIGHO2_01_FULL_46_14]|uniref:TrpR like protein, YerC/YecD n=2 Tax=Candidatus Gottesmaniibacteriota TaxID=1752720 RepID=A0A1F5ZQZ7_9BACT|nr:MAG: hypothetical protein A2875_03085 [Candidatus Gottesmanbacteria bacterium RIFCSPHIGHO2_01_FULL_46_14]OGG30342.1 MAG: hypothetical protein A2971_01975 [Candidatus Gottesmanbacteria bacterium RIFCSPLOWO2_01_FULL_46_21]
MTQISKYPLRKEIENRMLEVFLDSIGMVKTREHVQKLIDDLFSPTERVMLAKRLSIALLLLKKYDQRTVARILNVSLGTVNKVSLALQKGNGGYELVVNSIVRQEKFHAFLEKIDETLVDIVTTGHSLPNWRRVRWETKIRNRKPY